MAMKMSESFHLPDTLQEETEDHPKVIKHDKNDDVPGMKQTKFFGGAKAATPTARSASNSSRSPA